MTGVLIQSISPARAVAFQVLESVASGAFASDSLLANCKNLSSRDAGLTSQIVFGCLRFQGQLDYLIQHYSGRKAETLDFPVLLALRTAIFQLRYLERVPPHAVVHESVELVKVRKRSAAGLANAVLRKVNRNPVAWPDTSTELSCPQWLLDRWTAHFGEEEARLIARAALQEPAPYVRVAPGSDAPEGARLEPTSVPGCFKLLSAIPTGARLHDISSQAILPLLDLRPGHTYLDLCAAPGNKTLQALEAAPRVAVACDISLKRLRAVPPVCSRVVLDATRPLPFAAPFNRIFIDAPCSGTGTLGRNPEIKWRVQPLDFERFHRTQVQILRQALDLLAPGGRLLYATCSLEREENEQVAATALAAGQHFGIAAQMRRLPGRDEGDGFYAIAFHRNA